VSIAAATTSVVLIQNADQKRPDRLHPADPGHPARLLGQLAGAGGPARPEPGGCNQQQQAEQHLNDARDRLGGARLRVVEAVEEQDDHGPDHEGRERPAGQPPDRVRGPVRGQHQDHRHDRPREQRADEREQQQLEEESHDRTSIFKSTRWG